MYTVQIDQSGKIENTKKHTVVAMANGIKFSILVSAQSKREVFLKLKKIRPKQSITTHRLLVFSTLLFLLLKENSNKLSKIIIDTEFQGHTSVIREHLFNLLRRYKINLDKKAIIFAYIGKKSPAHGLAIRVYKGKLPASRRISSEEILKEFRK